MLLDADLWQEAVPTMHMIRNSMLQAFGKDSSFSRQPQPRPPGILSMERLPSAVPLLDDALPHARYEGADWAIPAGMDLGEDGQEDETVGLWAGHKYSSADYCCTKDKIPP